MACFACLHGSLRLPGTEATTFFSLAFHKFFIGNHSVWVLPTTLQSMMNANSSPHRFWPCHENGLIKTIQTIPHNLYVSFILASLYCGLRIILVYPNPQ